MRARLIGHCGRAAALSALILAATGASAQEMGRYYTATEIITGYDMRQRPIGYARCLRDVLVKVSGDPRFFRDPRVAPLAAHADALALSYDYVDLMAGIKPHDDQGTYDRSYDFTVRFDPAKIDAALAGLGQHPWRGERPVVVPVIAVAGFTGAYLLSAESKAGADQRATIATIARDLDMAVRIPTDAELAAWGAGMDGTAPGAPASPAQAVVAGTLEFHAATPGWTGTWHLRWDGVDYAWGISGVNYDEAFRDVIRGVMRIASGHGGPV